MPITTRYKIHDGAVIWPEHKPLSAVLKLRSETPADIWETTYQSNPVAGGGAVYLREWFDGERRYDATNRGLIATCVARWHSWDTAMKDGNGNDYTALTIGELSADYRLRVREVWRKRMQFSELTDEVMRFARRDNIDGKLRGVIVEDKASGISLLQTLRASAESWLSGLLLPFMPGGDKTQRANQAAVWCKNGSVELPAPSDAVRWLHEFESELFAFPGGTHDDMADSFSQLVIYCENLLAEGHRARNGGMNE